MTFTNKYEPTSAATIQPAISQFMSFDLSKVDAVCVWLQLGDGH